MTETLKDVQKLYGGEVEIVFYPNSHAYKLDSENLISVTSATGIIDKPALKYWSVKIMREYLEAIILSGKKITQEDIEKGAKLHTVRSSEAKDIGTATHDWAERYALSKLSGNPTPTLPEKEEWQTSEDHTKVINGITAFITFLAGHHVVFEKVETICYSKRFGYVGRFDAVALVDGKRTLIDYKTSKDIYSEALYQVGGYFQAYEEEYGESIDQALILNFSKETGELVTKLLSREDLTKHADTFLHCLALRKAEKMNDPYDYKTKQALS